MNYLMLEKLSYQGLQGEMSFVKVTDFAEERFKKAID